MRVPPSACSTSTVDGQGFFRRASPCPATDRRERPINLWISILLPLGRPRDCSLGERSGVARGSMAYSAVIPALSLTPEEEGDTVLHGYGAEHFSETLGYHRRAFREGLNTLCDPHGP